MGTDCNAVRKGLRELLLGMTYRRVSSSLGTLNDIAITGIQLDGDGYVLSGIDASGRMKSAGISSGHLYSLLAYGKAEYEIDDHGRSEIVTLTLTV